MVVKTILSCIAYLAGPPPPPPLVTDTVLKWYSDSVNDFSLVGLPLVALDLSDYIHITDNGVYSIAHMTR